MIKSNDPRITTILKDDKYDYLDSWYYLRFNIDNIAQWCMCDGDDLMLFCPVKMFKKYARLRSALGIIENENKFAYGKAFLSRTWDINYFGEDARFSSFEQRISSSWNPERRKFHRLYHDYVKVSNSTKNKERATRYNDNVRDLNYSIAMQVLFFRALANQTLLQELAEINFHFHRLDIFKFKSPSEISYLMDYLRYRSFQQNPDPPPSLTNGWRESWHDSVISW